MNQLVKLTDTELEKAIQDLKERDLALKTDSGQKYIVSKMRECIGWLESVGYKFEGDENALAKLWARSLREEFVRLGEAGLKNAVVDFASADDRQYKTFPQIPWIAEVCKNVGGDPRVEKGRRMQKEAERQMELDHKKEMAELEASLTPEQLEEIERKASEMNGKRILHGTET